MDVFDKFFHHITCCCPSLCSIQHGRLHRSLIGLSFGLYAVCFVTQNGKNPFPIHPCSLHGYISVSILSVSMINLSMYVTSLVADDPMCLKLCTYNVTVFYVYYLYFTFSISILLNMYFYLMFYLMYLYLMYFYKYFTFIVCCIIPFRIFISISTAFWSP